MQTTISNRVADETPLSWRDHLHDAGYEIDWVASYRSQKDDLVTEKMMRILRLRNAMDELKKAEALLLAGER